MSLSLLMFGSFVRDNFFTPRLVPRGTTRVALTHNMKSHDTTLSHMTDSLVPQINKICVRIEVQKNISSNVRKVDLHSNSPIATPTSTTPTHTVDIDGREHVLEDGGQQMRNFVIRIEVVHGELRGMKSNGVEKDRSTLP